MTGQKEKRQHRFVDLVRVKRHPRTVPVLFDLRRGLRRMRTDVLEPGSELSLTVRGYEVIVRTGPDGTVHLTCPELPQLSVSSPTVTEAISRTEDAINAILAGRVSGFSDTEPNGA